MNTTAYTNRTDTHLADVDTLAEVPAAVVKAGSLRAGMVLLDPDFDTPAAEIDHRVRSARGSGAASFMVYDYGRRGFATVSLTANKGVRVAAARPAAAR